MKIQIETTSIEVSGRTFHVEAISADEAMRAIAWLSRMESPPKTDVERANNIVDLRKLGGAEISEMCGLLSEMLQLPQEETRQLFGAFPGIRVGGMFQREAVNR